jgi:hypothetical protein
MENEQFRHKSVTRVGEHLASIYYLDDGKVFCEGGFISRSGVMRGHGKTPLFMAGMKCLPHRHVPFISAANNCMRPTVNYIS